MRRRPAVLLCALMVLLVAAPTGATTAADQADFQVRGCFGDPFDDVIDLATGRPTTQPRADIRRWCADYGDEVLTVAMQPSAISDPSGDRTWADGGAAVAFVMAAGDDSRLVLNLGRAPGSEAFEYAMLTDTRIPEVLCTGPATLIDDVWTAAVRLSPCLDRVDGLPDTLEIAAELYYGLGPGGSVDEGAYDTSPDAGTISLPRQVSAAPDVDRFGGAERVATSIEISVASFSDGAADAVVLARSDGFADAVVGAPLAVARNAPLLLTGQDEVSEGVLLEAVRAMGGPGEVILLGGTSAIRASVATQLVERGHTVTRIAGPNRFATSVRISRATTAAPNVIFLADGSDFHDGLIAGAAAPAFDGVVVLTSGSDLDAEVQAYLDANPDAQRYTVGNGARSALPSAPGAAGPTPAMTSALLATTIRNPTEVVIGTVERFPDGLAGGAYAARRGAPLLLSPTDALDTAVLAYLEDTGPFDAIALLGGTSAISATVAGQAAGFLR